jgi:hypothetical protein
MASINIVVLSIIQLPNSTDVFVNVSYKLAADGIDIAEQTPYREICQLIGHDRLGHGQDNILYTLYNNITYFGETGSNIQRNFNMELPLSTLESSIIGERDEIWARVTLTPHFPNWYGKSNPVTLSRLQPPLQLP